MNIALLTIEYPPNVNGGLGRYITHYMKYIKKNGHNSWVFTFNPGELPIVEIESDVLVFRPLEKTLRWLSKIMAEVGCLGFFLRFVRLLHYNLATYWLINKQHSQVNFDIVAVHDWMSGLAGILCGCFLRIPIVFHAHNTEFTMTPWGKKNDRLKLIAIIERILVKKAQKIIVPSDKMFSLVTGHGWNPKKISVIHHGHENTFHLNTNSFFSTPITIQLQSRLKTALDDKIVLFVGRLCYSKGIFNLIAAMSEVVKIRPDTRLVIIGNGDNDAIESLVRKLHLADNVYVYNQFLSSEQVYDHYQMADICIFPSLYEPFGLVALEAMSFGKPVILGDGFPDIFAGTPDNPTALFVNGNDPAKIAAAVLELLQDTAKAIRMGEAAGYFVQENFSWHKTIAETITVYNQAIRNAASKAPGG